MPLPLVNPLIRLQTAILCGVFLMLTACVAQQPISSEAEPVVNAPVIDLNTNLRTVFNHAVRTVFNHAVRTDFNHAVLYLSLKRSLLLLKK